MLKPVLILALSAAPVWAQRIEATADCAPAEAELTYDCTIALVQGGVALQGAAFTVAPDMPEMPMAHAVPPVTAEPMDAPGAYAVPLVLEMHGRWTLRLDVSAPRRDVVVLDGEFRPGAVEMGGTPDGGHGH